MSTRAAAPRSAQEATARPGTGQRASGASRAPERRAEAGAPPAQLALGAVVQGSPVRQPGRARRARPKPAPSLTPHPCVVLGVDPGATSGWAVMVRGMVTDAIGVARTSDERRDAVSEAQRLALINALPLVVVAETWSAGGWASHATLLGLGAAWGAWRETLAEHGIPARRIVRVLTQTWRAAILGGGNRRGGRDWKAEAIRWAERALGTRCPGRLTADEAEALCMAAWGSRAGEVREVLERLPKRIKGGETR